MQKIICHTSRTLPPKLLCAGQSRDRRNVGPIYSGINLPLSGHTQVQRSLSREFSRGVRQVSRTDCGEVYNVFQSRTMFMPRGSIAPGDEKLDIKGIQSQKTFLSFPSEPSSVRGPLPQTLQLLGHCILSKRTCHPEWNGKSYIHVYHLNRTSKEDPITFLKTFL